VSLTVAARIPWTFVAATDASAPEPHQNAALSLAIADRPRHSLRDKRIVVGRAEVQHFVAAGHHLADDHVVQCHARMVKPAGDLHTTPGSVERHAS
jgi:hypothetical protein